MSNSPRTTGFSRSWRFALGDPEGACETGYDDGSWRGLDLPHDWSVEFPFDEGNEGCTGYLPGGLGWYRKHFPTPTLQPGGRLIVVFDGVYNRSSYWLNGQPLGEQPYGYSPFTFDLTDHLKAEGEQNVLAVRVDHERFADSRWYTGSGIYRGVELVQVGPTHVPVWGTYVTTPTVTDAYAEVCVETRVVHTLDGPCALTLVSTVIAPDGRAVAREGQMVELHGGSRQTLTQTLRVPDPKRWGLESCPLYRVVTTLERDGEVLDRYETPFGVRTIRFDKDRGFFLNGERTLIKGVCLHHDAGLVGAAVPDGVWRRRLLTLKAGGCNAIRTAHNPPSAAFLGLCDELGFLVQDEFYDEWDNPKDKRKNMGEKERDFVTEGHAEFFQEWAERDLKNTMLRDRNHPCVFQWSIGNEIEWTYPNYSKATGFWDMDWSGNYFWSTPPVPPEEIRRRLDESETGEDGAYVCGDTAKKLAAWTRELDTTRPVTANCILPSASHATAYGESLDVIGYSYRRVMYDYGHTHYDLPVMGTENVPQWHEWKAVIEREFVPGLFLWTGVDYMGESNGRWPIKSTRSGLLNTAGFPKPQYHLYKTLWSDEPHIAIYTTPLDGSPYEAGDGGAVVEKKPGSHEHRLWFWHDLYPHWDYEAGTPVVVEAYINGASATLTLNGKDLGSRVLAEQDDHVCKWLVPFEPGELCVRIDGSDTKHRVVTPGKAAAIALSVDETELELGPGDVAHITAQVVDAEGRPVQAQENEVVFDVGEGLRVLGVDNGAADNVQPFQSNRLVTHQGRALLIVQAGVSEIETTVLCRAEGLADACVALSCIPASSDAVLEVSV
ncbi:MAG: glycoside hydrolase family 2 TIM barrel-domain containing protein [Planctomycetota bacterium]